ncbi:hypothetical protein PVK06_036000 [Gossypium arboreum]|uniref:ABC-2 type transporter transmembrane domain-containing protein n=1 Tax=Gossypium arboreum TaxID=29729 RepID=A0ABR0NIC0_GOSAR|nr:hypothetical protein PVK06_036000 [Gossypium arboreum]
MGTSFARAPVADLPSATVFDATGFLGRYLIQQLAKMGSQVLVPFRGSEDNPRHPKLMGDLGQILPMKYDPRDENSIKAVIAKANVVINLIRREYETRNFSFEEVNHFMAEQLAVVAFVAFVTSTIFLRTKLHPVDEINGNLYLSCLFFGVVHMMFNGFSELSLLIFRLPVFYKQRDNLFHPAWIWSIVSWSIRVPYSAIEAVVWSSVLYYTVGFALPAGRFFRFTFTQFVLHQMAVSLFRMLASLARDLVVANTFGSASLVFLLGGFVIPKDPPRKPGPDGAEVGLFFEPKPVPPISENVEGGSDEEKEFPDLPHRKRDRTSSLLDSGELEVGKEFSNKDSFLGALKQHSIMNSVNYNMVKSKSDKFEAKCVVQDGVSQDHPKMDSDMLASLILSTVKVDPRTSVPILIANIHSQLRYIPSYRKAWIAK